MTIIEGKTAYPYITEFKKEPFKSFVLIKRKDLGSYYFSEYNKVVEFYQNFNKNLLDINALNLENIYWFLLLRKYLREDKKENREEIYNFIISCECSQDNKIGFKFFPNSQRPPDIWSTYFALASIKLLGLLEMYLTSKEENNAKAGVKDFILDHKKGNYFLHCLSKDCEICKKKSQARTLYFVIESFSLLGMDVRAKKEQFRSYIGVRKRDSSLVFKLLCLKFLDLDHEVNDKEIRYLHQFQKENGGFSFKEQIGEINASFWLVYVLHNYSWLIDYNPSGIYSFINAKLNEILSVPANWNLKKLVDVSKLIILLSLIWNTFIEEIERVIFKELEEKDYVDLNQLRNTFDLSSGIEEIILYINLSYNFKLKILDNKIEFLNYSRGLSAGAKLVATVIYETLAKNSIISLSDVIREHNAKYRDELIKIKDVRQLVQEMVDRNFFKGNMRTKRGFSLKTKYYLYLDYLLNKIIVSDAKINTERLYYEKEKLKDIKNDIYNMTLNLKDTSLKIKEEIESYLILDEVTYARERLKYILRNALMEADFLNENIENSFNEELYYVNMKAVLGKDIARWKTMYSLSQKRLNEIDSYLKEKIIEKEKSRNLNKFLEDFEEKVSSIEEVLYKRLELFRTFFREAFERTYDEEKFDLVVHEFNKILQYVNKYDTTIYKISQKITTQERELIRKHKKIIAEWIRIKEDLEKIFDYYLAGFQFFRENKEKIENISSKIRGDISLLKEKVKKIIDENQFQEVFLVIKRDSDALLKERTKEIKDLQTIVKNEIKSKQRFYLLYRFLQEKLDKIEEEIIKFVSEQVQSLKDKVIEDRNRVQIEEFDSYVSETIILLKNQINDYINNLNISKNLKINEISKGFDNIQNDFDKKDNLYAKKLNASKELIKDFAEKSKFTIIQWEKFKEYFNNEIKTVKEECINNAITETINAIASKKKTNNINIKDLKTELDLSCDLLMTKIREMIEISKLNAELLEDEKYILVHTVDYYKTKELRNFLDNQVLKIKREPIGKILALYDSCIRNRTLGVNALELQNRINELTNFKKEILVQFSSKTNELQIDEERSEFIETKNYMDSLIENDMLAIKNIKNNLTLFNEMESHIEGEFNELKVELNQNFAKINEEFEKIGSFAEINEYFETRKVKFKEKLKRTQNKIEMELKSSLNKINDSNKLSPELGEFYVKNKNNFLNEYEKKVEKIKEDINLLKHEKYRDKLIDYINNRKIYLSQLLGTLERKVEDYVEIKEFNRAQVIIQKRARNIELEIKEINKNLKNIVKDFNKQSKDFKTKNKNILDNFEQFISEFLTILNEKVKSLERLILKSYVEMAIKAVANGYLTTSFLNNELKIKKQNIQDHLLFLISEGNLKGKFDPRLGIYYENPEVLKNLSEAELQVVKKMNFRVYMYLTHLKNFTSQYGSIIAFFTSVLTISYYIFQFSGGNLAILALPMAITFILVSYFFLKKRKEEKI